MKFSSFFAKFPELIETEFRNITILDNSFYKHIPPGNYAFSELFCADPDCDCRNVFIRIISNDFPTPWAVLRYGWESKKFYCDWMGAEDRFAKAMSGISLDTQSPYNEMSKEFLELFTDMIKNDALYAKRIQTHYRMFKEVVDKQHR
ncbi:MAG: hypothetical protein ACH346_02295 [Chthoniobacterales bacterium]